MKAFLLPVLLLCGKFMLHGNCLPYQWSKYETQDELHQHGYHLRQRPKVKTSNEVTKSLVNRLSWFPVHELESQREEARADNRKSDFGIQVEPDGTWNLAVDEIPGQCDRCPNTVSNTKDRLREKFKNISGNYNISRNWLTFKNKSSRSMKKVGTYMKRFNGRIIKEKLKNATYPLRYVVKGAPPCSNKTATFCPCEGCATTTPRPVHCHPKSSHVEKIITSSTWAAPPITPTVVATTSTTTETTTTTATCPPNYCLGVQDFPQDFLNLPQMSQQMPQYPSKVNPVLQRPPTMPQNPYEPTISIDIYSNHQNKNVARVPDGSACPESQTPQSDYGPHVSQSTPVSTASTVTSTKECAKRVTFNTSPANSRKVKKQKKKQHSNTVTISPVRPTTPLTQSSRQPQNQTQYQHHGQNTPQQPQTQTQHPPQFKTPCPTQPQTPCPTQPQTPCPTPPQTPCPTPPPTPCPTTPQTPCPTPPPTPCPTTPQTPCLPPPQPTCPPQPQTTYTPPPQCIPTPHPQTQHTTQPTTTLSPQTPPPPLCTPPPCPPCPPCQPPPCLSTPCPQTPSPCPTPPPMNSNGRSQPRLFSDFPTLSMLNKYPPVSSKYLSLHPYKKLPQSPVHPKKPHKKLSISPAIPPHFRVLPPEASQFDRDYSIFPPFPQNILAKPIELPPLFPLDPPTIAPLPSPTSPLDWPLPPPILDTEPKGVKIPELPVNAIEDKQDPQDPYSIGSISNSKKLPPLILLPKLQQYSNPLIQPKKTFNNFPYQYLDVVKPPELLLLPDLPHYDFTVRRKVKVRHPNRQRKSLKIQRRSNRESSVASVEGDNSNSSKVLETAGEMASDLAGRVTSLWHCVLGSHHIPDTRDVRFFLYTRRNVIQPEILNINYDLINKKILEQPQRYDIDCFDLQPNQIGDFQRISDENREIVRSNYLNIRAPTKILIHGYTGSYKDSRMTKIKDAYLNRGRYNVIQVDWEILAAPPCYIRVTHHSKFVGETIAQLLNGLYLVGLNMSLVHLVGFSLGAQVAGFTGNNSTIVPICRITGLDPALPLFLHTRPSGHLDRLDAKFVDVIHTCGGILAMLDPLGHVDFYPNGGTRQPGCEFSNLKCSHSRAPQLFAESVNSEKKFTGQLCLTWEEYVAGDCDNTSDISYMGEPCSRRSLPYLILRNR